MDFRQTIQPNNNRPSPVSAAPAAPERKESKASRFSGTGGPQWLRILTVVLLAGVVILLLAVAVAFTRGSGDNENKFVDTSKYQAVFLNNGQV